MAQLPASHVRQCAGVRNRDRDRAYDAARADDPDRALLKSARWQKVRRLKLSRNPLCEDCEERGLVEPAEEVHHILPRREYPDLAFVMSNLRSLCRPCHRRHDAGGGRGA